MNGFKIFQRELDICNKNIIELKKQYAEWEKTSEAPLAEEARRRQEYMDSKRCEYLSWAQKTNKVIIQDVTFNRP